MGFSSGLVSFMRFKVIGTKATAVDDAILQTLSENAFIEHTPPASSIETGFVTGDHLNDVQFTGEKNVYCAGKLLLFALRIDTHKIPPTVKHSQRRSLELAAAAGNPSGFASRAQKREAKEKANLDLEKQLHDGKFRRSRMVPILWDFDRQQIYCGATSNAVAEQLMGLMRRAFEVNLEPLYAMNLALDMGRIKVIEDLRASPLTASPPLEHSEVKHREMPMVPWSNSTQDFLGNEFLINLWFVTQQHEGEIEFFNGQAIDVMIDRELDMWCAWGETGKQSIRAFGPTQLPEAKDALASGKWPRRMGLILADKDLQFDLTLQGDQMIVTRAKLPNSDRQAETPRDVVEDRLELIKKLAALLDMTFLEFLMTRTDSEKWIQRRREIREWTDSLDKTHKIA